MTRFEKGGQLGWYHEHGLEEGFFHTYDTLRIGQVESHKIHVFLPREYESSEERYPVVYINDGDTIFWAGWSLKSARVAETLSELYRAREVRKMIVVAIVPVNRENEYTHTQWFPQRPFGGLDIYADYLAEDLKAWIDENYRTLSERQYTTLAGCSHGGLASFYTAMKHPHKFGNAICMSSSFWAGLDLADGTRASSLSLTNSLLVQKIKSTLLSNVRPRLWIDWGLYREGGFHNAELEDLATIRGREMVDLLLREYKYKVNHEIFVFEDKAGGHDEIAWGRRFRFAFKTLLGTQPMITASYGPVSAPQIHIKHPQTTQSHSNSSNNNNAAIRRVVSAPINARANSPASTTSNSYLSGSSRSNCSTPISVDSDDEEEERRPIAPSYKTGHIPNHSISIPIVAGRRYSVQS